MNLKKLIPYLVKNNNLNFHIYNDKAHSSLPLAVRLEFVFDDVKFESWGVSHDKDLAFFKALMELIERVCLAQSCSLIYKKSFLSSELSLKEISQKFNIPIHNLYPDNSNGLAINISSRRAKESAKLELIERHAILVALFLNISPRKIDDSAFDIPQISGHKINFYYWMIGKYYVVIAADFLSTGGFIFTHACSSSLRKAVTKSFEEITPNVIYFEKNMHEKKSIASITKNDIRSFNQYWKFSGDTRILNFLESNQSTVVPRIPALENVFYSRVKVPSVFSELPFPLYCYRAISPEAQQLFFDNWDEKYVNPKFSGLGSLPEFPHIIS